MAASKGKAVPVKERVIYNALAESFRAGFIYKTADPETSVSNFSYLPDVNRWLVFWGPNPPSRFPDNAKEWRPDELRVRLGLEPAKRPNKAAVLAVARRLASLAEASGVELPEDIVMVLETA